MVPKGDTTVTTNTPESEATPPQLEWIAYRFAEALNTRNLGGGYFCERNR